MQLFIGCSDLPQDRKSFYRKANAIEYRVGLFTPPKARVLKDWAANMVNGRSPEAVRSVWVAWQAFTHRPGDIHKGGTLKLLPGESASNLGHFMHTAENVRVWTHIKEQAVNVGASRILLETTSAFTPSTQNKEALSQFVKEWAEMPDNMRLIWHPAGFWTREEAAELCADLGMILAIDPLVDENEGLPDDTEAYFQMLGRHGLMDSYSDDDLERILDAASVYEEATIVFRTRDSLSDAERLRKMSKVYEPNISNFAGFGEDFDDDDFDDDEDFDNDEG